MQLLRRGLHYIARRVAIHRVSDIPFARPPVRGVAVTASFLDFSRWGTRKANRNLKIALALDMTDPKIEEALAPLRASVKEQVSAIWMQSRDCLFRQGFLVLLIIILDNTLIENNASNISKICKMFNNCQYRKNRHKCVVQIGSFHQSPWKSFQTHSEIKKYTVC